MNKHKQKGASEIISYALLTLVIMVIVFTIYNMSMPTINNYRTEMKMEQSLKNMNLINNNILKLINEPIGSSKKININLNNLYLDIDSDSNKIEMYQITFSTKYINELKTYVNDYVYTYRNNEYLMVVTEYQDINLTSDYELSNINNLYLYFTKTDINKIEINLDLINEETE